MPHLYIFFAGASLAGTIFLVSLLELIFTVRRRHMQEELTVKVHELRANYNTSLNKVVLEEEEKVEETEKKLESISSKTSEEKSALEKKYQAELEEATTKEHSLLLRTRHRAQKLEEEAKLKADEYFATRQKEVESELMDLVMHVTKKVLPKDLDYKTDKELVLQALRDVKLESSK